MATHASEETNKMQRQITNKRNYLPILTILVHGDTNARLTKLAMCLATWGGDTHFLTKNGQAAKGGGDLAIWPPGIYLF